MARTKTEIGRETLSVGSAGRAIPQKVLRAYLAKSQSALIKELKARSGLERSTLAKIESVDSLSRR